MSEDTPKTHRRSPSRRAPSYKKATSLQRIDSNTPVDTPKLKITNGVREMTPPPEDISVDSPDSCSPSKSKFGARFPGSRKSKDGSVRSKIFGAIKSRGGSFNEGVMKNSRSESNTSLSVFKTKYPVMRRSQTEAGKVNMKVSDLLAEQGKNSSDSQVSNRETGVYDNLLFHPKWKKVAMEKNMCSNKKPDSSLCAKNLNKCEHHFECECDNPWVVRCRGDQVTQSQTCVHDQLPRRTRSHSFSGPTTEQDNFVKSHKRRLSDSICIANRLAILSGDVTRPSPIFDRSERRAIMRYCTPPRDIVGPEMDSPAKFENQRIPLYSPGNDFATVIENIYSKNPYLHRFIRNRGSGRSSKSAYVSPVHRYMTRPGSARAQNAGTKIISTPPRTGITGKQPSGLNWRDIENFIDSSPHVSATPQFPTGELAPDSVISSPSSPCSTIGGYSSSTPICSPDISSPSSVTSNDSLVDSLKHALFHLTSRIKGKTSRSVESSPSRTRHHRPRSVGELEDARVQDTKSRNNRSGLIHQISRDRNRKKPPTGREKETKSVSKQLVNMLRDYKPGSSSIGARIATSSKPVVIGNSYTLSRQRPARPKKDWDSLTPMSFSLQSSRETTPDRYVSSPCIKLDVTPQAHVLTPVSSPSKQHIEKDPASLVSETKNPTHDSGCLDTVLKDYNMEDPYDLAQLKVHANRIDQHLRVPSPCGEEVSDNDLTDDSFDGFYEKMLAEDLKSLDFDLEKLEGECRDSAIYSDDGATSGESEFSSLRFSIKQTMKLIEEKYKDVPSKGPVKRIETGKGIKDIVKHLEEGIRFHKTNAIDSKSCHIKSVRERTRELVECATLTRIRQNSVGVGDEPPNETSERVETEDVRNPVTAPLVPPKKGLVKELVCHFQQNP